MQYARFGALAVVMLFLTVAVAYLGMLLVQTSTDLDSKNAALARQASANAVLEQANSTLLTDQAKLGVYLEAATDRFGVLSSENVSLQSDLVAERDRYTLLDAELESLMLRHTKLASAHDALSDRHDDLESDLSDLAAQHKALADRYADVQRLARTILELQHRIVALEAQLASNDGR